MAKKTAARPTKGKQKTLQRKSSALSRLIRSPRFAYAYVALAVALLLVTTIFWAHESAQLNNGNADQLVNSYLAENTSTFQGAQLPSQHSFLIKWPIFYLVHLFGATPTSFITMTTILCLLTIGTLAAILYKIERRPLVFGTLILALASVLLLIPAQPYPGGLLPINMAMIATRNIEYVLLLGSLYLLVTQKRIRSWKFAVGIGVLGLLIASDKLFLMLTLGGAMIALVAYVLTRRWQWASQTARWLVGALAAGVIGIVLLVAIQATGLTHVGGQTTAAPYGLAESFKGLMEGVLYAVTGLLTNLGANPVIGTTIYREMPHQLLENLFGPGLVPSLVNLVVCVAGIGAMVQLAWRSLFAKKQPAQPSKAHVLTLALIWTTVAAVIVFVGSNHYYAADARYLTLSLFAVFMSLATVGRSYKLQAEKVVGAGLVLIVSIALGTVVAHAQYRHEQTALAAVNQRNALVADVLKQHPVQGLVGDYWRVLPIKLAASNHLNVVPLENCTKPRSALNSQIWQPDLRHQSFAYLLSFDQKLTDYPSCTLDQVTSGFGRPNSSVVLAGGVEHPQELLLFYDHGAQASAPKSEASGGPLTTIAPISPENLLHTLCNGPTIMNIVAHQDDDLLFLSPDLLHEVQVGHCVRTIYLTAGDAGGGNFYWLSRERGSEAAYAQMLGFHDIWVERVVKLADHQYATIANPRGNFNISLIFMHLPDGNLNGQGFPASHHESLAHLEAGQISTLHAVDGQSEYTSAQLRAALTTLMHIFQPTEIHTQAGYISHTIPDHSDHLATGHYAQQAHHNYEAEQFENRVKIPLQFYIGYPVRTFPDNVSGPELEAKETAFFAYAQFDSGVCHNAFECSHMATYNGYLHHQYIDPQE